jgi:hypothetical protein
MESIDLTGLEIYDIYGIDRLKLAGKFTIDEMTNKLASEWIQYVECQADCGRSDYCKFASKDNEEIRCGVAVTALKHFLSATYKTLSNLSLESKQNYLDGAFYLVKYIFESETKLGVIIYDDFSKYFGRYAPWVFSSLVNQREILNIIGRYFKSLPELRVAKGVLFVEGKSELVFLNEMRKSNLTWFLNLLIKSYGGKDNVRPKRIEMLLRDYKEFGYELYIQGDADGKSKNKFQQLINKNLVDSKNAFIFAFDFETAVPYDVFYNALVEIGIVKEISIADYINKVTASSFGKGEESVGSFLLREFSIDIADYKIPLATAVGRHYSRALMYLWKNEDFMNTDFGRFLEFISRIPK